MPLTLLLGGARSGKSRLAVELAAKWRGPVLVVATAEAGDHEMRERIERHRRSRPPEWKTVEEPVDVERVLSSAPSDACVLIEDLTLWISNLLLAGIPDEEILRRSVAAAETAASRAAPVIAVSNEVGSGIVPENPIARRYRDLLGDVNRTWAGAAINSALVVAGRLLPLHGAGEWLGDWTGVGIDAEHGR
jgi:adenosyl cobinamide kinase/adenosyl cobinamide phosphate guanylyltransferase